MILPMDRLFCNLYLLYRNLKWTCIIFSDEYYVVDPANPFNNIMKACNCWETVAEKARAFLQKPYCSYNVLVWMTGCKHIKHFNLQRKNPALLDKILTVIWFYRTVQSNSTQQRLSLHLKCSCVLLLNLKALNTFKK